MATIVILLPGLCCVVKAGLVFVDEVWKGIANGTVGEFSLD